MERRQLPRWEIKKEVQVKLGGAGGFGSGYMEDLNLKGMCIALAQKLPEGACVKIDVKIDNFNFHVEASVPWVKEDQGRYVHGLSFNSMMDEDKSKVDAYITSNCFTQLKDKWWSGAE
jgi:hypothetical protein